VDAAKPSQPNQTGQVKPSFLSEAKPSQANQSQARAGQGRPSQPANPSQPAKPAKPRQPDQPSAIRGFEVTQNGLPATGKKKGQSQDDRDFGLFLLSLSHVFFKF